MAWISPPPGNKVAVEATLNVAYHPHERRYPEPVLIVTSAAKNVIKIPFNDSRGTEGVTGGSQGFPEVEGRYETLCNESSTTLGKKLRGRRKEVLNTETGFTAWEPSF